MIVRPATAEDREALLDMGAKFYTATDYPYPYCRGTTGVIADMMIATGLALVAEHDGRLVGMVGLVLTPFLFNAQFTEACEVMWWVDPDDRESGAGMALLRAVEPACRAVGADRVRMMHLPNSPAHVGALYQKLGYIPSEFSYTKDLH